MELTDYLVAPTDTIRIAMEKIEANHHRVVVVVDGGKVVGTLSDGDLRRAFLHDHLQLVPVGRVMQLNPQTTTETDPARQHALLREKRVTVLPIVNDENLLVDIAVTYEPFEN